MKAGWERKKLGDVATLQRGFDLPTQDRVAGDFPIVSSSGVIDAHHKSAVCGTGVVTGRSGSIGNVFFIEEDYWPLNTVLYVKDFHGNDPKFIFHLLKKFDLKRFATGTGVPTLNRNFVHDELVNSPLSPNNNASSPS
jgi:type I restriction enzyme S subunit